MKLFKQFNKKNKFTFYHQLTSTDCGAACLCMIANYFGKKTELNSLKKFFEFTRVGVSINDIVDVAKKVGFSAVVTKLTTEELETIPFPVILYWKQEHFVVYRDYKTKKKSKIFILADPAYGEIKIEEDIFENNWKGNSEKGIAIILQPEADFDKIIIEKEKKEKLFNSPIFSEVKKFTKQNKFRYLIAFGLLMISLVANWLIPFIFQNIIDQGVIAKNLHIVFYFLLAQVVLFISYFLSDFFSRLILTKFNFSLSVNLKENMLFKLIKLPINYFDTRLNTETLQRIGDQNKIQSFVTWKGMELVVNSLNILIFGGILMYYNYTVFAVYLVLSALSFIWVIFFLNKRAILEYAMFLRQSENSNKVYEFIMSMPEIKINNAQNNFISKIIQIQHKLNELELKSLYLNTYQVIGVNFLTKIKEITAIGICAYFIIGNQMSLGVLLSISYVVGQLVGPMNNMIGFIREAQDAKIANDRINEVYSTKEENIEKEVDVSQNEIKEIDIKNLSFKYPGKFSPYVLNEINFSIQKDSVTAIVGASGSGKTTLLKLLLAFYDVEFDSINIDSVDINRILPNSWRKKCGIVMQDGNIFSGTIADNIAISSKEVDYDKLVHSCEIACILDFIKTLPMGFDTKIGNSGIQLSGGQKQRILIARAVYKDPEFIFLDEATSALDAENEKQIQNNLQEFFQGKTVVIIAHRLSTVKSADQIIVLKNGQIVEKGNHQSLVESKSDYFNLVKNQLELGV
ncbi:peptidase domain-containing ABC transporter [Aureivirga marina]|uniref:peptidase domain-containing ABC transporter n=1 Tax=Aureivirga marina TaxID=1182451 RepID=UPI0018C8DAA0|nr:peptidase domain-containing ABC transporter [Aureivirga marina]